jgi:hypothetical protein
MGNPTAISLGPGKLKIALLGSTEPTDLVSPWPVAWIDLGYTFEGSDFNYQLNTEEVTVAEELDPLLVAATGRTISVKFTLAEITATNLKRALNGGTIVSGGGFVTFEPPSFTAIVRNMYGWESDDLQERWVFRQCLSTGAIETQRRKGASKAGFPFEVRCEKPASVQPFKTIFASPARA